MDDNSEGVFSAYSAYYDLFYQYKDYAGEAAYVHELIQQYSPGAKSIIEFGCGTGGHASEFAKRGYQITGLDRSDTMIEQAQERTSKTAYANSMEFVIGDLRNFRSVQHYDVVLALFHVLSYQTSNEDLLAAMTTASSHLRPGGLFIFDCWYGPGVLTDPPVTRVRRMQREDVSVIRIAEPHQYPNENRVDVNYEVIVETKSGVSRITETHAMRYFFTPEIDFNLTKVGLRRLRVFEWLTEVEPVLNTWNACFVSTK